MAPADEVAPGRSAPLDIIATNVAGLGAVQLAQSLLPALERCPGLAVERIYLPDRGPLVGYRPYVAAAVATRRRLPHAASRLVESLIGGGRFDRGVPLLVLGDVPFAVAGRQTVVVQTPHLFRDLSPATGVDAVRYATMRAVFRRNVARATAIVVQSGVMRDAVLADYPVAAELVHIVQPPPPEWLLDAPQVAARPPPDRLRLFYPAAAYPHKNHALFGRVDASAWAALVERLVLTLPPAASPAPALPSLVCVGRLDPPAMRAAYGDADALVFPSTAESYGFPLIEAMWLGLPVVAADLPFARTLCRDAALYFDPLDPAALLGALAELRNRLAAGWRPDWTECLVSLPRDWACVATVLAAIATS